ncbi:hypothetical protein lerEdw1_003520 [Lerista edwardsae]|nr:hypothetical protein lerEdw1_003520 [Lerista edwardsae]
MVPLPGPAQQPPQPRLLLLPAAPAPPPTAPSAPRKRQRLAHLSPEEKALRRKLKNRVAAQSARDRKKARMGELEQQALELEEQNQQLLAENLQLKERARSLALENGELRLRLGLPALRHPQQQEEEDAAGAGPGGDPPVALKVEMPEPQEAEGGAGGALATGSAESAALSLRVPLQQGQAQPSPASSGASAWIRAAWTLRMLSLDPDMFLRGSGSAATCLEQLQQGLYGGGEGDSLPASPGSPLGPAAPRLDAINELIRFDHEYTKPFFLEIVSEGGDQANVLVRIEEVAPPLAPSSPPEPLISVKEEPADILLPELGLSHLLSPEQKPQPPCPLLDASSDSGYEGSPSPFSDLSSPLDAEYNWDEAFATELFPQLISVRPRRAVPVLNSGSHSRSLVTVRTRVLGGKQGPGRSRAA